MSLVLCSLQRYNTILVRYNTICRTSVLKNNKPTQMSGANYRPNLASHPQTLTTNSPITGTCTQLVKFIVNRDISILMGWSSEDSWVLLDAEIQHICFHKNSQTTGRLITSGRVGTCRLTLFPTCKTSIACRRYDVLL